MVESLPTPSSETAVNNDTNHAVTDDVPAAEQTKAEVDKNQESA